MTLADETIRDGAPALTPEDLAGRLLELPDWALTADGKSFRRNWRFKSF